MRNIYLFTRVCLVAVILAMVCAMLTTPTWGQATSELNIIVGPSLQLGDLGKADEVDLVVSPTGVIAAFVPTERWPGRERQAWMAYRVSADGGLTWTGQFEAPMLDQAKPIVGTGQTVDQLPKGAIRRVGLWEHMVRPPTWFAARYARFSDDMMSYQVEALRAEVPQAVVLIKEPDGVAHKTENVRPLYDHGQMIHLNERELLLPMHGTFKNDNKLRSFLIRSLDGGRLWRMFATIGYESGDPDPNLPGEFAGFINPTIAQLPSGTLLAVMQTHDSQKPPYKPLYASWSDDDGANWSKPKPTQPNLFSVSPTLVTLDGGIIACAHGRPGLTIAFSTNEGHTWTQDYPLPKVSASQITGQIDIVKIGPDKLLALAGMGSGGTRVFPITVEMIPAGRTVSRQ